MGQCMMMGQLINLNLNDKGNFLKEVILKKKLKEVSYRKRNRESS
jgi:hypothetical protein